MILPAAIDRNDVAQFVETVGQREIDALIAEGVLSVRRPRAGTRFPRSSEWVRIGTDQDVRP